MPFEKVIGFFSAITTVDDALPHRVQDAFALIQKSATGPSYHMVVPVLLSRDAVLSQDIIEPFLERLVRLLTYDEVS